MDCVCGHSVMDHDLQAGSDGLFVVCEACDCLLDCEPTIAVDIKNGTEDT